MIRTLKENVWSTNTRSPSWIAAGRSAKADGSSSSHEFGTGYTPGETVRHSLDESTRNRISAQAHLF